jgi:hypothetical protein
MVHALHRAAGRLRPGGVIISIRPHRTWRPAVAVVTRGRRLPVTELAFSSFETNLTSAERALERVVANGLCTFVGVAEKRWRTYLDRPAQMRRYLELISPPRPRFLPGSRARLQAIWERAPHGARVEITEPLVITVLRRRR